MQQEICSGVGCRVGRARTSVGVRGGKECVLIRMPGGFVATVKPADAEKFCGELGAALQGARQQSHAAEAEGS